MNLEAATKLQMVVWLFSLSPFAASFAPPDADGLAPRLHLSPPLSDPRVRAPVLLPLAAVGASVGPAVDAVHNAALLQYDVLPLDVPLVDAHTSYLIPPLLALTYAIIGGVLASAFDAALGRKLLVAPPSRLASLSARQRAGLAVGSAALIVKASELLTTAPAESTPGLDVLLLGALCLVQWAALDGSRAALALALTVAAVGPLAELPFIAAGCWHYTHPDVFPLAAQLGEGSWAGLGLHHVTPPCYFAVATDTIAVGRWLNDESRRGPAAGDGP